MTRKFVDRTLGVHAGHELLLALERAGIARFAQAIIKSPNNTIAQEIVRFCSGLVGDTETESRGSTTSGGFNFTDRLRTVLKLAREEASEYGHRYLLPKHLLLAIIREGEGRAILVITHLSINLNSIETAIREKFGQKSIRISDSDIPYTAQSKKVLKLAMDEARNMNHDYIGTEHLLLALISEESGETSLILKAAGIDLQRARDEVRRVVGKY